MWTKFVVWLKSLFKSAPQLPAPAPERPRHLTFGIVVGPNRVSPVLASPFNGTTAFQYCSELAELMKDYIAKTYPGSLTPLIAFKEPQGVAASYQVLESKACDVVIELQLNAFDGSVKGTETLCSSSDADLFLAGLLQRGMCGLFARQGKQDRGVKALSRGDRGGLSAHAFPGGPNCIVEPLFCDNAAEAKMAVERRLDLAKCLVDGVVLWARKQNLL